MTEPGPFYLGIDVGTQGTKGLLLDAGAAATGAVVGRAARSYDLIQGLPPGAAEQHPDVWEEAVAAVTAELLPSARLRERLAAVGVSGQQHGFVALDAADRVLRPAKLWCDTSTAAEARELSEALGHAVPAGFTASKILWFKRHEPERFARLRHVLLPHDYVNFLLTGARSMEAGDASGTGFFDPVQRVFDRAALAAIDERLESCLPELIPAGSPAGRLTGRLARRLALPPHALVASGGGDNMMSAIGSGATRPGVSVLSLGTSGTVFAYSDRPVLDPEGLIAPFCDSTGGYLPLLCVMNVTGVTAEVRGATGLDLARLTALAEAVAPGAGGLLFLPYLQGERVPDLPAATGALLGIRPGTLSPGGLFRAALEGTSLNLAWGVQRMRRLGLPVTSVRVVGGAARNPLWRQILADCLDAPVEPLAESESAALGAALQALWTERRAQGDGASAGEVAAPFVRAAGEPAHQDPARVAFYRELRERFEREVGLLF